MSANPESLKSLCLDYVSRNIDVLYMIKKNSQPAFIDSNVFLPSEVSEALLTKISENDKLNDVVLSLFNDKNVSLRKVVLPKKLGCRKLTTKGLKTLKKHKIKTLKLDGLAVPVNEMVRSLGKWTVNNLQSLSVSNSLYIYNPFDIRSFGALSLSKFKHLRFLDVSYTKLRTNHLRNIVEELSQLESLNISETKVDTLVPLEKKKYQLYNLKVYNLKKATLNVGFVFDLLGSMSLITHLDLSTEGRQDTPLSNFLTEPNWLPNLISLDVSGRVNVGPRIMQNFLTTHKKLRFLGLMFMADSDLDVFTDPIHPLYNPDLVVTGHGTLEQALAGLKHYANRPIYIEQCLNSLFNHTKEYNSSNVDAIKLILDVMNCHIDSGPIILPGICCLYNLTRNDLASKVHLSVMTKVVEATIDAMKRFRYNLVLQKYSLKILCSNRIPKDVKVDFHECAKLVMSSFCFFNHLDMDYMSVDVLYKLAKTMTPLEVSELFSIPRCMTKLLAIIMKKISSQTFDRTMNYTLNFLWFITNESVAMCKMFIDNGGLIVYTNILNSIIVDGVKVKILALMKNIAKTPNLRAMLINNDIIRNLRHLLPSTWKLVGYFSAEIIAHLACEHSWDTVDTVNGKAEVLEELRNVIKQGVLLDERTIKYISIPSLIVLLHSKNTPSLLWAACAILNVSRINDEFVEYLKRQNVVRIICSILSDVSVDLEVHIICHRILRMMK